VNLVLGRLLPDHFPFELRREPALAALERQRARLAEGGQQLDAMQVARGFLRIANANMAEAIARVSVARGYDVRQHALVVFGGAGGQHACRVAELLGIETILFHPLAGVLSAYGIGLAPLTHHVQADAGRRPLDQTALAELDAVRLRLESEASTALAAHGVPTRDVRLSVTVDVGYAGTDSTLPLHIASVEQMRAAFEREHRRLFGYVRPEHPLLVHQLRVEAASSPPELVPAAGAAGAAGAPIRTSPLYGPDDESPSLARVYARPALAPGQRVEGPAIVLDGTGSIVVDPGFELTARADGILCAARARGAPLRADAERPRGEAADPIELELMSNRFMSIAEQMGHVLRRTAGSTNIRERLDFSCAVFTREAGLVANAPHIPVHLGAMSESVLAVWRLHPEPERGDVFVVNDPALGGSHLPDITVVTPVHDRAGSVVAFVASRGHHADVGGTTPGSMPADSRRLEEEGVVFCGERVVSRGVFAREALFERLTSGPYPARAPHANVADLEAQIAANQRGVELLTELLDQRGVEHVCRYMELILDYAEQRVRALIASLPEGSRRCADRMDDGTCVAVQVTAADGQLHIDFSGSSPEHAGNLNSPRAVTLSAVLYVLRALVAEDIPLNGGCLRPVRVTIPSPSLLDPSPGRAVAAGNVETSQRVVDVLLGAFGRLAASQGTMNNLTFGNERLGYYETLAGGAGAGPDRPGASAVHTHMTNTRITDPEILEARYPVRLLEFSVRRGSGGAGAHRGGDGVVRELSFLEPLQGAILSDRRATLPFGLAGGGPAAPGRNLLNGRELPGRASFRLQPEDRLRIETPGGGGYGPPAAADSAPRGE
jgi:5-oxoprolinase (ATP-hydrolysing)